MLCYAMLYYTILYYTILYYLGNRGGFLGPKKGSPDITFVTWGGGYKRLMSVVN